MKANHNKGSELKNLAIVFINMSKIQYESKSQLYWLYLLVKKCFYQYVKDTI